MSKQIASSISESDVSQDHVVHKSMMARIANPKIWIVILAVALVASLTYQELSNPLYLYKKGLEAVKANDTQRVELVVSKLEDRAEYKHHVEYLKGVMALRAGDLRAAIDHAETARLHPDLTVEANVLAGESAYKMGAPGNAKIYWEKALDVDAESIAAHRWLGVLYYDVGAMSDAVLHLQVVSRLSPTDPRPDRLMGLMNRDYERPESAIPHYRESLKRDPKQSGADDVRRELAECHIKLREYEQALETLKDCVDSPKRSLLKARCLLNLGSVDEARTLAIQLVDDTTNSQQTEALQLNAEIAMADSEPERAAEYLKRATETDPYSHSVRTQYAQVLGRIGEQDEAKQQTQKAEELQGLWRRFSDLQIDAINRLTDAPIRYEIGVLANKLGRPELAVVWFKAALAIDPRMRSASESLSETLNRLQPTK